MPTSQTPRVSVIIPSYNGEHFVEETVRSVLGQTMADFELIILDDGSTDGTRAILRRLADEDSRIRLIEKANEGLVATLNRGIAEARAPLIARLDHDDIALPERLARQADFLDANPDHVGCGTNIREIDETGRVTREPNMRQHVLTHEPNAFPPKLRWMPGPTPMMRTEAVRRIGGYRPQFLAAEDRDLCWRLGALGPAARFAEVLVLHRVHGGNMSRSRRRTQLYSHVLGDFSAIARHYGVDDSALVARIVPGGDYLPIAADYRRLLAPHYPAESFWLYFLCRYGAWPAAGYTTKSEVMRDVARHVAARPFNRVRLGLLRRAIRYLRRDPEVLASGEASA